MKNFENLTLLICSYENLLCLQNVLKSFVYFHENQLPIKVLISENSIDNECEQFLIKNNIPYFRNKGFSHSEGINFLFEKCQTKYALLLDTDIIFLNNIQPIYNQFIEDPLNTLLGEYQGEFRGGKRLYPRIAPWFCFVNMDNIKKYNLKFNDLSIMGKEINGKYYDVGSYLYENVIKNNLKVIHFFNYYQYYKHYEGMSWRIQKYSNIESNIDIGGTHNNYQLYILGQIIKDIYDKEIANKFNNIDLKNKFI